MAMSLTPATLRTVSIIVKDYVDKNNPDYGNGPIGMGDYKPDYIVKKELIQNELTLIDAIKLLVELLR